MNNIYFGTVVFLFSLFLTLQITLLHNFNLYLALCITLASLFLAIKCPSNILRNALLLLFFSFLGITNGLRVGPSAAEQLESYFGKEIILEGYVDPLSIKSGSNYTSLLLECERLQQGSQTIIYKGKVRLTLPAANFQNLQISQFAVNESDIQPSTEQNSQGRIIVGGKLEKLTAFHNPGGFDSELYNRINNIGGLLRNGKVLTNRHTSEVEPTEQDWLSTTHSQSIRNKLASYNIKLRQQLQEVLGDKSGQLLGSMLLGGSNTVDEETREIFTTNGLSHLLSVSGTHLVLLASMFTIFLRWVPQPWRKLFLIALLILYALLCGLRPPVLRALLMSIVVLLTRQEREGNTELSERQQRLAKTNGNQLERGYLLCLVAILLLLVKPLWLLDIGFQLSFGAATGLLWLLPACQRAMQHFMPDFLAEGLGVTLAAQLGTLPILIGNFHQVSLISLVSNLLLVPVLEFAVFLVILGTVLVFIPLGIADGLGMIFLQMASFFSQQLLVQAQLLASLPYNQLVIGRLPLWCALLYYVAILVWADVPLLQFLRNQERRAFLLCSSIILTSALLWQHYASRPLTVYFLDVAQGDCVAIVTPNSDIYLYDTGGLQGLDTGKRIIAPFVRSLGINQVEALILSHYDYDHVGGAVGLLQQIKVREIVLPQEALDEDSMALHEGITLAAHAAGSKITFAEMGSSWNLGAGALMQLLVPNAMGSETNHELQEQREADILTANDTQITPDISGNDASTILTLHSPQGSLLLTGDLGSEGEEKLNLEKFKVFKAGHHGSKYSNSEAFLRRIQPQITIISCGSKNRYGHPHEETLSRLQDIGSVIFRTDLQGCLKVVFDENGPKCYSYIYDGF